MRSDLTRFSGQPPSRKEKRKAKGKARCALSRLWSCRAREAPATAAPSSTTFRPCATPLQGNGSPAWVRDLPERPGSTDRRDGVAIGATSATEADHEKEDRRGTDRRLFPHHGQDRRRSGKGRATLDAAVARRQCRRAGHAPAAAQRPPVQRHERAASLVGGYGQRILLADLDDLQAGYRTRRSGPEGRKRNPGRLRQPIHENRGRRGRRGSRQGNPVPESLLGLQCCADRRAAGSSMPTAFSPIPAR
jgi:hypothetical protein